MYANRMLAGSLLFIVVIICVVRLSKSELHEINTTIERVYFMKKCSGSGCPYTASWLAHINLYRKIPWWLDSTKMEAASFNIFDRAKLKFQLSDPEAYYVHHMSMFEHLIHKKYGFAEAKNKTLILSKAALAGECTHLQTSKTKEYVTLIPFYGGLPPGVTKDLTVKSIGQGNSLVDSFTKGLQTMATMCSCLKYFGRVIIGVARDEDRILVNDMLHQKLSTEARHHVNVVQFQMSKPAHLPFHLLAWGQQYVRVHNCYPYYVHPVASTTSSTTSSTTATEGVGGAAETTAPGNATAVRGSRGGATAAQLALFSPQSIPAVDPARLPRSDLYDICWPGAIVSSYQGPVNVVYLKKFDIGRHRYGQRRDFPAHATGNSTAVDAAPSTAAAATAATNATAAKEGAEGSGRHLPYHPLKFVYYTESDQVVRFDGMETLRALSAASNDSTFFVGKRREKGRESNPEDYMGALNQWRECGVPGFSLTWPKENVVRID